MWNPPQRRSGRPQCFYVYMLASKSRVLYIGVTNGLAKRVWQHKFGDVDGFTKKYKVTRLVHWESFDDVRNAIDREKELKGWTRVKKMALVEATNPKWKDLAEDWYRRRSDEQLRREFQKRSPSTVAEEPVD